VHRRGKDAVAMRFAERDGAVLSRSSRPRRSGFDGASAHGEDVALEDTSMPAMPMRFNSPQ